MLAMQVFQPAHSEWTSPILFSSKKDGTLRFFMDYHYLNAVTILDSYPIPCMDGYIDSLADAEIFCALDAKSVYWTVQAADEDRQKTAFSFHNEQLRFTLMSFDPRSSSGTIQSAMNIILYSAQWHFALLYFYDTIVHSESPNERLNHVQQSLTLLNHGVVTLNLRKWELFTNHSSYLSPVIKPGYLKVSSHKTEGIHVLQDLSTSIYDLSIADALYSAGSNRVFH